MTEIKNEETMAAASGGTDRQAALYESLVKVVGEDVMKKLDGVYSNVDVCRILAENGVALEKVEKVFADAGLNMNRIGLQLDDDDLSNISGGFYDEDQQEDIKCSNCGNGDRKEFSRQF